MSSKDKETSKSYTPFQCALNKLMSDNNTTHSELAKFLGKTRQAVSYYCSGKSAPDFETLVKIANYFNTSSDYLLGIEPSPEKKPSAVSELGLDPCVINGILKIKTGKLLGDGRAQDGLNVFLIESLKDNAIFYRYINYLCGAVKTEMEDSSTYLAMLRNDANSDLSIDEKYRLAELTILNTLEEAAPGITHLLSITVGHRRIKPELDNACELFREMLERMTGYKKLKEG